MRAFLILLPLWLAACAVPSEIALPGAAPSPEAVAADRAARNFVSVVDRVEPVAEAECRARTENRDCNLRIVVDSRPGTPPNAFYFVDRRGRPTIAFTLPLIADVRNQDELAFILGHEAAHHIAGHRERTLQSAQFGAQVLGELAQAAGQSPQEIRAAAEIGAAVGARRFSKDFELEADALGTIIALRAGFDPVRGSAFFSRVPDPGDVFLGTHPPNAERVALVRRVAASAR